jgi:hypothetical protein
MEHITKFKQGYDCIKFKCINDSERCYPGSGGSHGVHGLTITFISKGPKGAAQFMLYTGWLPLYCEADSIGSRYYDTKSSAMPADLGYHSKVPMYEGQEKASESCEYCDGKPCYYDGSGLSAYDAFYTLVNGGDEALWRYLDEYYNARFEGGEYPEVTEYCKPLR